MPTDSLILFINRGNKLCDRKCTQNKVGASYQINKQLISTPSLKMVLTYSRFNVLTKTILICNGYCLKSEEANSQIRFENFTFLKSDLRQYHKQYFLSANGKEVPLHVPYSNSLFLLQSREKKYSCDQAYKTRKYKLMHERMFCWAKQMLAGEISKVHNLTYVAITYTNYKRESS